MLSMLLLIRRTLLLTFALLLIALALFMLANLMCRSSLLACSPSESCPGDLVCISYSPDESTCSAAYCQGAQGTFAVVTNVSLKVESSIMAATRWTAKQVRFDQWKNWLWRKR